MTTDTAVPVPPGSLVRHALQDVATLLGRSLRHVARSPDTIVTTAVMPVMFLLLFVYVLGGAIETGTGPYVDYLLPGIFVVTIASGVAYTSYRLFLDVQSGMVERLRSMPTARSAVLWSHVLTSVVANGVSLLVVLGVGLLMGFRSSAGVGAWALVVGLLLLLTLALTWLAVAAGLAASSVEGASAFSYPLVFLPFLSSAFVPTDAMAAPVRWFAEHQPVTAIVDALRGLLGEGASGREVLVAAAWCGGILVLAQVLALRVHRRRIGHG